MPPSFDFSEYTMPMHEDEMYQDFDRWNQEWLNWYNTNGYPTTNGTFATLTIF